MQITAVCPACESSYKVSPSLCGKAMRCPNAQCRTVFTVPAAEAPAAEAPAPPQPPNGHRAGSVGDMIPMLPAEAATAAPAASHVSDMVPFVEARAVEAPAAKAAPSWNDPPPVRRPADPAAAPVPTDNNQPREVARGAWEPPPVRRGQVPAAPPSAEAPAEHAPEVAADAPPEPAVEEEHLPHPPARRIGLVVAAFALIVMAVLGGGAYLVYLAMLGSEGGMSKAAEDEYTAGHFAGAIPLYKQLAEQFPTSDKHDSYVFMQALSDLRNKAAAPDPDIPTVLDAFFPFLTDYKGQDQALKDHAPDLGKMVVGLADGYVARHGDVTDEEGPLEVVGRLEKAFDAARALDFGAEGPALQERFTTATGVVRAKVALVKRTRECVARLKEAVAVKPASLGLRKLMAQLKDEKARLTDIDRNPEVVKIVEEAYANHLSGVTYQEEEAALPGTHRENDEATFVVTPSLLDNVDKAPDDDPVKLALARGVLYALKRTNGQTKWAVRVGVDTTALPVRVPATQVSPERILVASADAQTLAALDANGERLWEYPLSAKCIGRPLVVGNLAYLATYDGKVHEIELAQGKLKGVYDLGQPLTVGGAAQPGTNLLYFPADDFCVYVLDAKERRCVAVLYTGHPAGSLRGEPMVLTPDPLQSESWLVLNQTRGLDAMQLRVYRLPVGDRDHQAPEKLGPETVVPGWTWFPPAHDGEKMAMLGDTGVLGLFGVRQARNLNDPPLFPMLPRNFDLASAAAKGRARSEVVEMQDKDFWLLANGVLQRLYLELNATAGLRLEPAAHWTAPDLGSPLHAGQVEARPDGGATLYLATRPLKRQTCLATAVDDKEGAVLWQRQLGLVCQGEPLELRPPDGAGAPVLLALDRGGGLFAFDPAKHAKIADGEWREGGQSLFPALDDGPGAPPVLLPGPDGHSAYEIASPGNGSLLFVRRVEATAGGLDKTERTVPLSSPLAGTPAVTASMLVLPLAKGVLARLTLPLAVKPAMEEGPNWRDRRAPPDARGRATALADGTFLTTDGSRGLTHWQWTTPKEWKAFPAGKDALAPTLELDNSLIADPLLLPTAKDSPARLCVADAAGAVTLLTVAGDGGLKKGRSWNLGRITAGPYVQTAPGDGGETRVGCIVDEKQLIWLDPDADKVLWTHPAKPGAALVGRPRLVGGLVVVADESGLIVGLDPKTGERAGTEYRLHGSTAPAASPLGFGADRLFVPLSDGTVLLPPLKRIRP